MLESRILQQIKRTGQEHLLRFWDELGAVEKDKFAAQLEGLDWDLIGSYRRDATNGPNRWVEEVRRATPPSHVVRIPTTESKLREWKIARPLGEATLREGKVGVVLLAGGQGTRLGFKHSKGLFPIGPVTGKSLLEIFATQVLAISEKYGCSIPYFVMTSDGTHQEIESFFKQHAYFGLNPDDVFLFHQGYAPSIDLQTGKVLLASKASLSLNPDGHGGIFAALWKAGLFDKMKEHGIEYLFSHQVDNPLVKVCDPEFIGLHIQHGSEVSTKVVAKTGPEEKVGVAVDLDGHTRIIEYIDLPEDLSQSRDDRGELRFWAGNTAIHLFNRSFLERVATSDNELPWHLAIKKIPYVDPQGNRIAPESENGVKFERFIFDTLPLAKVALIVETIRDEEFAPLKNKEGEFSADYVQTRMVRLAKNWLKELGKDVPDGVAVEISPRFAMSADDLATHASALSHIDFNRSQYLCPADSDYHESESANSSDVPGGSSHSSLQPLIFDTFYRPQVWGGRLLSKQLGRSLPSDGPFGEAWDLSSQTLHVSRVLEGPHAGRELSDLWENFGRELTGKRNSGPFPLLVKWLECHQFLSLQVHPDDEMAQRLLNEPYGKSEAWVVVFAEPTARVFAGLKPGVSRDEFMSRLNDGTLQECLHSFTPVAGDCISIPAGTIHAAGGGLVIAEVQQSSDATFRLFDWNRVGLDAKPRTLHIDQGLDAIDWNQGPISPTIPAELPINSHNVRGESLVDGNGFRLERYGISSDWSVPYSGEFTIWMVLEGNARLSQSGCGTIQHFPRGSTVVVPAEAEGTVWSPENKGSLLKLLCIRLK